ncbi:MAG TPA: rRNA maturation RNase YbeY [Verrucomicrobiae bacterium]|nr:rRNA maturation RNase YbeY [Verrucomicrobiae bacterium]
MNRLVLRNRQRILNVDLRLLRRIVRTLVMKLTVVKEFELDVHLVDATEMTRINEAFLNHKGSTDVITFDYADSAPGTVNGEMLICLNDAVTQAKRFRTSWQSELVRYLVHGLLHLRGFDDSTSSARDRMKREENRLLRQLERLFPLRRLSKTSRPAGQSIADRKSQVGTSRRRLPARRPERKPGVRQ